MGVLRAWLDGGLEVTLGGAVMPRAIGRFAGAGQGRNIVAIEFEHLLVLCERVAIVLSLREELGSLQMQSRVRGQRTSKGDQLGLGLSARSFLKQKIDQFQACPAAIRVRVGRPHAVHGIVIVAEGVLDRSAAGRDAAESKIDRSILWSA